MRRPGVPHRRRGARFVRRGRPGARADQRGVARRDQRARQPPVAEARAAYPLALGRAFHQLKQKPRVCTAYNELYELSLMHPQRMLAFVGFKDGELRPVDAAMLLPGNGAS